MFIATWAKQRYALEHNYYFFLVVGLGVLLYTFESLAKLFVKYWMKFGKILGYINARILLSVLFFFILIPIALIKKLIAGNEQVLDSSWIEVVDDQSDFSKPW